MKTSSLGRIAVLICLLPWIGACQRNASGGNARITFQVPAELAQKLGSTSATTMTSLKHVVAQATAPDIADKIHVMYTSEDKPITTELSLEIPSGDNRLIQLLAVFEDPTNKDNKLIYYGDVTASLKGGTINLEIPIKRLGTGAYDKDSDFKGRILDSNTTGPSGELQIIYRPPGKPGLLVKKESIFGGWFSAFVLDEIPLDYLLPDGSAFATQLTTSKIAPSNQVLKITHPDYYERRWISGGETFTARAGNSTIVGYFAKDASFLADKKVCVYPLTAKNNGTLISNFAFSSPSKLFALPIRYFPTGTTPSFSNQQLTFSGGLPIASCGSLSAEDEFHKYMRWEMIGYTYNGNFNNMNDLSGMHGLFGAVIEDQNYGNSTIKTRSILRQVPSATGPVQTTLLLPGVEQAVDGINFYTRPYSMGMSGVAYQECRPEKMTEEGWALHSSRKKEFFLNGQVQITQQGLASLNFPSSRDYGYCLTRQNVPVGNMHVFYPHPGSPADGVFLSPYNTQPTINKCYPVDIGLSQTTGNGTPYNPFTTLSVVVGSRNAPGGSPVAALHFNSDCSDTSASSKTVTFTNHKNQMRIYYKFTSPYSYELFVSSTTPSLTLSSPSSLMAAVEPSSFDHIALNRNSNPMDESNLMDLTALSCTPVKLMTHTYSIPVNTTGTLQLSYFNLDGTTPYTLPTGTRLVDNCVSKNSIPSDISFAGASSVEFAIETGVIPPENFIISISSNVNAVVNTQRVNILPVVHHIRPSLGSGAVSNPAEGTCQAIDFRTYSANGNVQNVPAAQYVEFSPQEYWSYSNGAFSPFYTMFYATQSDCIAETNATNNYQISGGASVRTVWTKIFGAGTYQLAYMSSSAVMNVPQGNFLAGMLNFNISPYLGLKNTPATIVVNTVINIGFYGGKAPYTVTVQSGAGSASIVSQSQPNLSFQVNAPNTTGNMTVLLTDSSGLSQVLNLTVTN